MIFANSLTSWASMKMKADPGDASRVPHFCHPATRRHPIAPVSPWKTWPERRIGQADAAVSLAELSGSERTSQPDAAPLRPGLPFSATAAVYCDFAGRTREFEFWHRPSYGRK